jgi:glycosyltransferase domain-containing protein
MLKTLLTQLLRRSSPAPAFSTVTSRAVDVSPLAASASAAQATPIALPLEPAEPPDVLRRKMNSTGQVTLLLPTIASRMEFLRSTLAHLEVAMPGVRIVISDHTEDGDQEAVRRVVTQYPRLQVDIVHHPAAMHFLKRLSDCAKVARTPFVVVHADDDYMLPAALDESIEFLQSHQDYVCCQGRTFFLKLRAPRFCAPKIHGVMTRAEGNAAERIVHQCGSFTPTLYALTRREAFIEANETTLRYTTNVVFWQYLSSCLLLAKGKSQALDSLYYLRLDNPDGWRATLIRRGDRTHWPHLIMAPEFSHEMASFREGVLVALEGAGVSDADIVVDDCCIALVRRAFSAAWPHDDAERALLKCALAPDSAEHLLVRYCGSLSLAALTRHHREDPQSQL